MIRLRVLLIALLALGTINAVGLLLHWIDTEAGFAANGRSHYATHMQVMDIAHDTNPLHPKYCGEPGKEQIDGCSKCSHLCEGTP